MIMGEIVVKSYSTFTIGPYFCSEPLTEALGPSLVVNLRMPL